MSKLLPTVDFFGTQVTKVIIGDNPMTGHSYIQDRITGEEMAAYYTQEKVVEALFTAVDAGFNTLLPLACPKMIAALKEFRRLGGKMNLVFQPYPAHGLAQNIEDNFTAAVTIHSDFGAQENKVGHCFLPRDRTRISYIFYL